MHLDTFHKKLNCILTLTMLPRYSPVFSRLYILLYIHMQNSLNRADRASTVPNQSSNEFSGKNGALRAQTMTIPVTTGANRDATILNLGLYRPITRGKPWGCLQRIWLIWWRHGRCGCRPGLPLYLTAFPVTRVDSQLFSTS